MESCLFVRMIPFIIVHETFIEIFLAVLVGTFIVFCSTSLWHRMFKYLSVPGSVRENVSNSLFLTKDEERFRQLEEYMHKEKAWRNPDIDLKSLAVALATNRTYIYQAIHQAGYRGVNDYIYHCRIEEFKELALSGKVVSIQDTFFDVGFRSKSTAFRYFKLNEGMTPSEYLTAVKTSV